MHPIIEILSKLSDRELAFLYHYNLDKYMLETQERIKSYVFSDRKISNSQISDFIQNEKSDKNTRGCPRCQSTNWNIFEIHWEMPLGSSTHLHTLSEIEKSKLTSYHPKKQKIECNICGYVIHDPNLTFWDRLLKLWKK